LVQFKKCRPEAFRLLPLRSKGKRVEALKSSRDFNDRIRLQRSPWPRERATDDKLSVFRQFKRAGRRNALLRPTMPA
jgi:hypothetical protein